MLQKSGANFAVDERLYDKLAKATTAVRGASTRGKLLEALARLHNVLTEIRQKAGIGDSELANAQAREYSWARMSLGERLRVRTRLALKGR